jgi:cytochrome c oxidase assembly protein subunit 11
MALNKNKYFKLFIILFLLIFSIISFNLFINKLEKDKLIANEPIIINLLTSVHPNLPWNFQAVKKKIFVRPGEIKTIEYLVKNLSNKKTTGIATFAYFPSEFGNYIKKLNCFCYDAKALESKKQDKYSVVVLIDPEVTKDSKTKNIKEVTIQFTFFDYKEYKKNKS